MKRHLGGLGMTPEIYRAKWHLPHDYPMVAPNYSATRSGLAKTNGLGASRAHLFHVPSRQAARKNGASD